MREIKFRAWDEVEGKFRTLLDLGDVSGEGSVQFSVGYAGELQIGRLEEFHNGVGFDTTFTKFPIVQFTGLKDKNDKEIYEGDIVRKTHEGREVALGSVMYSGGTYFIEIPEDGYVFLFDDHGIYQEEVIGNIYENPEMLGDSK